MPSCSGPHRARSFHVLPRNPQYVLRFPDTRETPFSDLWRAYNGFEPGRGWIDLQPGMELRIENAYYENGASRRGLTGFLGTEVARYEILPNGLRLLAVQPMPNRPTDQVAVQHLIAQPKLPFHYYRLYFEIVFARSNNAHGSVLLRTRSKEELEHLAAQLVHPEEVCAATSAHCTVFPEACSVSVEMKITVNGKPRTVDWGSLLAGIVDHPQRLHMKRLYAGRLTPLQLNPLDPQALRLPLLPGDQITWE